MTSETNMKSYVDNILRRNGVLSKQDSVKKFIEDYRKRKAFEFTDQHLKLSSLLMAIESLSQALTQTIPSAQTMFANANIGSANAAIQYQHTHEGEIVLSGQCPIGQAFLQQASFIHEFTTERDSLALEVYHYFFNYARSLECGTEEDNEDMQLLAKKLKFVIEQTLVCGEKTNTQAFLFRDKEITGSENVYILTPKPALKLAGPNLYFVTPIGLSGLLSIDKLYMFPEIMGQVSLWVKEVLTSHGVYKERLQSGYKQLLTEFDNIMMLYEEYPNSRYNNTENSYYTDVFELAIENSVYTSKSARLKLKPGKKKLDILVYINGKTTNLRYNYGDNPSGEGLVYVVTERNVFPEEKEIPIPTDETILFNKNCDLLDCLEFELNFITRMPELLKQLEVWKADKHSLLRAEHVSQEAEREAREEREAKARLRDTDI